MLREDLVEAVLAAQREVFHAVRATSTSIWIDLDLTMAQMKTLRALEREGPAPIGRLAETLGVGLPTASHLVDRLVQAGLAERTEDPADRRRTLARLSAGGARLVQRLSQRPEQMRAWLLQMEDDDLAALLRGTRALARIAAGTEPAGPASRRTGQ